MPRRTLHDGRDDGLTPLESIDLDRIDSFSGLVRAMGKTAFGGRQLGNALDILEAATRDAECTVVMTLSGAMTVAKQGRIVCDLIERGVVDAIVATGALVAHGVTETMGLTHYAADPARDDAELYAMGYNRVYDTLEMEKNLDDVARLVAETLDGDEPEDGVWSSARFCRALGARLETHDQGPGILRSAFLKNVPVFIPAFTDSEMGLDTATHAMGKALRARAQAEGPPAADAIFNAVPVFNPFLDLQQYARFVGAAKRLAIFTIGGGVPRNWAQQAGPYFELTSARLGVDLPRLRFHYGVRICPEPDHWGGLSGCTYREGVSWGKFVPPSEGGRFAEVMADATLVLPLLIKALFEVLDAK